jgi:hypothetical protein
MEEETLQQKHYRLTHCPVCDLDCPNRFCSCAWHSLFDDAPKLGDEIYAPTAIYLGHGRDDFVGGICQVTRVYAGISAGKPVVFVSVQEREGTGYNWETLKEKQGELRERYGDRRGHPDPDLRPEFNDW